MQNNFIEIFQIDKNKNLKMSHHLVIGNDHYFFQTLQIYYFPLQKVKNFDLKITIKII